MPKLKYSEELKLKVIHYLMEGHSLIEAEREFHIGKQNIQKWRDAYELHGVKGSLIKQNNHNKYTGDFKGCNDFLLSFRIDPKITYAASLRVTPLSRTE